MYRIRNLRDDILVLPDAEADALGAELAKLTLTNWPALAAFRAALAESGLARPDSKTVIRPLCIETLRNINATRDDLGRVVLTANIDRMEAVWTAGANTELERCCARLEALAALWADPALAAINNIGHLVAHELRRVAGHLRDVTATTPTLPWPTAEATAQSA
jgi:hypothetical protein